LQRLQGVARIEARLVSALHSTGWHCNAFKALPELKPCEPDSGRVGPASNCNAFKALPELKLGHVLDAFRLAELQRLEGVARIEACGPRPVSTYRNRTLQHLESVARIEASDESSNLEGFPHGLQRH